MSDDNCKKKICIVGHFAKGENLLNGQTVKTKIIAKEVKRVFGKENVHYIDTRGGVKRLLKSMGVYFKAIRECDSIIILPAENGLRVIAPLIYYINKIYKKKLHYMVIGGWLPQFIKDKPMLASILKSYSGIYVETNAMKKMMNEDGFNNVFVIPNCKELDILSENELVYNNSEPYKLCTFSRVMKEKGIEIAVNAVKNINTKYGRKIYSLDIFGQVDANQVDWFNNLKETFPEYIRYGGLVPFDKSTDVLKNYYALLFPTYYEGEGFAGTLIDAMAAGVPVIASDWKYNSEIVLVGETGVLIEDTLEKTLNNVFCNNRDWNILKVSALKNAKKYLPSIALESLINNIGI